MVVLRERARRLDRFIDSEGYAAVWFGTPDGFAWATGGDNRVDRTAGVGQAAVGYVGGGDWRVVTNTTEARRLAAEQLPPEFTASVVADEWHQASLAAGVAARSPEPAAADFDVPGAAQFDPTRLRLRLADDDRRRLRQLGAQTGETVEAVCRELEPTDTEREVAAGLRVGLAQRGIDAPVVLVGGGDRAPEYRHPTPTGAQLDTYAVVAVTARRDGLYVSCTRTVGFEQPDWLTDRHRAACTVETAALAATADAAGPVERPGTAGAVFEAIQSAYAEADYPDEWRQHHQGGATGYAGREWLAKPDSRAPVLSPAAYAYNPTVEGAKSEDTALVTDDGVSFVTATGDWPTTTYSARDYSLDRPDVLSV